MSPRSTLAHLQESVVLDLELLQRSNILLVVDGLLRCRIHFLLRGELVRLPGLRPLG